MKCNEYSEISNFYGLIKICKYADVYNIPKGWYPVTYFEESNVEIPIMDKYDFMRINRKHIDKWLNLP